MTSSGGQPSLGAAGWVGAATERDITCPPSGGVRLVIVTRRGLNWTAMGVAVLTGQPVEAVHDWLARNPLAHPDLGLPDRVALRHLPPEWQRVGRRRAAEAMAHMGREDALAGFEYWVEREQRGRLVEDHLGLVLLTSEVADG